MTEVRVRNSNNGTLLLPTTDLSMKPMIMSGKLSVVAGHALDIAKASET